MGSGSAISWNCSFLDDDLHQLQYDGRAAKTQDRKIIIGDCVWICCNVTVLKGVIIPNGCVVGSNSVVKSAFSEENTLIAGNPARIVKRGIRWW
jgi:acetyltransferase-like isoleucine patch superfamily enzyme